MRCNDKFVCLGIVSIFIGLISSCTGGKYLSQRPIAEEVDSEGQRTELAARPVEPMNPRKEHYIKEKELKVKRRHKINDYGSLSQVDDKRSFLLADRPPIKIGDTLDIRLDSNKSDAPKAGATADPASTSAAKTNDDPLFKSVPTLDPAPDNTAVLVKRFKVKVIDVLEDGSLVVHHQRQSIRDGRANNVSVKAVLPMGTFTDPEAVVSSALQDVAFRESKDGDISERLSSQWEDEYTLRLSGFDEAESKSAIALEQKRKDLQDFRDRQLGQMKSMGQERQTMAKERNDYLEQKKVADEKIKKLDEELQDSKSEVKSLKKKLGEEDKAETSLNKDDAAKKAVEQPANKTPSKPKKA